MRTLLLSLCLVACGGPIEADDDVTVETSEDALQVRATGRVRSAKSRDPLKLERRFGIDATNTIFFVADRLPKRAQSVAFEVEDPSGNLWQRSESTCDSAQVFASMPVAGTWVQTFAMSGRWKVKIFVDGAADPADSVVFVMR